MKPIFIVGVGRSGTTLLANLLGSHAELSPVYETPFLRNLLLLCAWVEWYQKKWFGRKLSSLVSDTPLRRRFLAKCEKYQEKCAVFSEMVAAQKPREFLVAERIKQPYELFHYGDSHILFDLNRFRELTDEFLESLRAISNDPEHVYRLARTYVDELFRDHCEHEGKPGWVNKTPRLLLCLDGLFKLFPTARCIHILRDGRDVVASNLSLSWGPEN
ncbi:MAG: sulfotransferase, partial [Deltaproteobacteria bacterium]|nr:sulfotransferase [Deltaproteobacteria bacterium]